MKAITVTYLPVTNTKPARLKAFAEPNNNLIMSYPMDCEGEEAYKKVAVALCNKMGWPTALLGGGIENGYVFVFKNQ